MKKSVLTALEMMRTEWNFKYSLFVISGYSDFIFIFSNAAF